MIIGGCLSPRNSKASRRCLSFFRRATLLLLFVSSSVVERTSAEVDTLDDMQLHKYDHQTTHAGQTFEVASRIVGGVDVPDANKSFPWYGSSSRGRSLCGATLIAENLMLSAAHCHGAFANGVHIGETNYAPERPQTGIHVRVLKEIMHPHYDPVTIKNDFMVIVLASNVTDRPLVDINLNFNDSPKGGERLEVIGFGRTSEGGPISSTLKSVSDMEVVPHSTCQDRYGSYPIAEKSMLCAFKRGAGSCQGDSGGPIFDQQTKVQVGVVSFGVGCASSLFPGVYSRTSGTRNFLETFCDIALGNPRWCPSRTSVDDVSPPAKVSSTSSPTLVSTPAPSPAPTPTPTNLRGGPSTTSPVSQDLALLGKNDVTIIHGGQGLGTSDVTIGLQLSYPSNPKVLQWKLTNAQGDRIVDDSNIATQPGSGETIQVQFDHVPAGTYTFSIIVEDCRGLGHRRRRSSSGQVLPSAVVQLRQRNRIIDVGRLGSNIGCRASIVFDVPEDVKDVILRNGFLCYPSSSGNENCVHEKQPYFDKDLESEGSFLVARCSTADFVVPHAGICQCGVFVGDKLARGEAQGCQSCSFVNDPEASKFQVSYNCSNVATGGCVGRDRQGDCIDNSISSSPPLALPEDDCADHGDESFPFETGKRKGCQWLKANFQEQKHLCGFLDVAQTCPATCEKCQVETPERCNDDNDSSSSFELFGAPGNSADCHFLKLHKLRFGHACKRADVALTCPETCQLSRCLSDTNDKVGSSPTRNVEFGQVPAESDSISGNV